MNTKNKLCLLVTNKMEAMCLLLMSHAIFYFRHGFDFVENTYLFHFSRKDTQHNFSPYFYILLNADTTSWRGFIKMAVFLPQMICVIWFGCKYYNRLPLACFLQTFAFVSFNKVCTSQVCFLFPCLLDIIRDHL